MEKNNIDHLELWEKLYGDKTYAFDFAKRLMLKSEFKNESEYSWDIDLFDENDDQYYIASCYSIKIRNKKPVFEIGNIKFIVAKNPDSTYAFINPIDVGNLTNPINADLYIMNAINSYKVTDNIYIQIKIRKIKKELKTLFVDIFEDFLNTCFKKSKIQFNNKSELRDEFVLSITNYKNNLNEFMKSVLVIDSIINLLLFRMKKSYGNNVWDNDDNDDKLFYNILIIDDIKINEYFFAFDNKILITKEIKNLLIKNGFESNEFKIFNEIDGYTFYEYPFINSEYNFYFSKITKK